MVEAPVRYNDTQEFATVLLATSSLTESASTLTNVRPILAIHLPCKLHQILPLNIFYIHYFFRCQNTPGSFQCICANGLVGDPITSGCRKPGDCFTDTDCPVTAVCIDNRCINPCEIPKTCGTDAICTPGAHAATCRCPSHTKGDPNVVCVHLECTDSNDCTQDKACVDNRCVNPCSLPNVCGQRATCVALGHVGLCSCEPGSTGDPLLGCVPVQYCASDSQCPAGTKCNSGVCTCK